MSLYYVGTIDRLLGQTVRYGTVYETMTSAKKALSTLVKVSRNAARQRGYGMVYSQWSTDKTLCELTFGKDPRSSRWELLAIQTCQPGIPYEEKVK